MAMMCRACFPSGSSMRFSTAMGPSLGISGPSRPLYWASWEMCIRDSGKSLNIDAFPVPTARLVDAAVRFPQYAIDERSVYFTCAIAHEIVRTNSLSVPPAYRLLTEEFFTGTFAEVQSEAERLMRTRLAPCAAAVEPCGCRQDS